MRDFLHKLMVDITRHPREVVTPGVDFDWDDTNSRIWQAFRAYECWFGRRAGIRLEGGSYKDEFGRDCWKFGTWENIAVFTEGMIRAFFKGLLPKFEIVRVPQFITPDGVMIDSPFRFAIAIDNSQATSSSTTLSCTITGSNVYLFASNMDSSSAAVTTATFNSVAMTSSTGVVWVGASNPQNGMYLAGPTTGTNTMTASNNLSGLVANSYSGVAQTTPDTYGTTTSGGTTITLTLNTATANCWMVMFNSGQNGTTTAGTNATVRQAGAPGAGIPGSWDSNGNIATGSFSMTVNGFSAQSIGAVGYKFAQVAVATVNSGFFFFAMK